MLLHSLLRPGGVVTWLIHSRGRSRAASGAGCSAGGCRGSAAVMEMSEALEAWARRVLSDVDGLSETRLRHSAGVARRAAAASAALLATAEADLVQAAAWRHDIGYAAGLVDTSCHAIDGARHLRRLGAPDSVVGLVAYHSGAEHEAAQRRLDEELAEFLRPPEHLLNLLTYADYDCRHQWAHDHRGQPP